MHALFLIPLSIAATAIGGWLICALASVNPHLLELSLGAGAALLGSIAGVVPLLLARQATQLGMSQAALVGTMGHLFVTIALASVALLGKFKLDQSFMWWLAAFYWMSLIALAVVYARAVKSAPPATTQKN